MVPDEFAAIVWVGLRSFGLIIGVPWHDCVQIETYSARAWS